MSNSGVEDITVSAGTLGTLHIGSDSYGFTVAKVVRLFKTGKHKGRPCELEARYTCGRPLMLKLSPRTGRWGEKGEKPCRGVFVEFGAAVDELDRGY